MKKYISAAAAVGALSVAAVATPAFAGNDGPTTGGWLYPAANIKFCRTLDVKVTGSVASGLTTTVTVTNKDETSLSFTLGDSGSLGAAEDYLYHQLQIACDPDDRHEPYAIFASKGWKSTDVGVPGVFGGWVGNLPNRILEIKVK